MINGKVVEQAYFAEIGDCIVGEPSPVSAVLHIVAGLAFTRVENLGETLRQRHRFHRIDVAFHGATLADEAQMPFGGVKASGYGRLGGKAVIAEFTDLRWIIFEDGQT